MNETLERSVDDFVEVPVERIVFKAPIREEIREEDIINMADSILSHGQIHPIVCKPCDGEGFYEGVIGRLRYEGAKRAKREILLVRVHEFKDDLNAEEWQLVENLHRREVPAMAKAKNYKALCDCLKRDFEERAVVRTLAERIEVFTGERKAERTIYEYLQLNDLTEPVSSIATGSNLGLHHGLELLRVKDPKDQLSLAEKTVTNKWSWRELKKEVDKTLGEAKPSTHKTVPIRLQIDVYEHLKQFAPEGRIGKLIEELVDEWLKRKLKTTAMS